MSVKFTTIARAKAGDPDALRKYCPVIRSKDKVILRHRADQIAQISTLGSVDLAATLEAFLTISPYKLVDGDIVQLGDLGTFSLRIHSQGADTAEEVTGHNITNTLAGFRPSKRFRDALNNITYEEAAD